MDLTKMSVEKIKCWVDQAASKRYGVGIKELARRLSETQAELTAVRASLAAAEAIIEKLPKTADGVPVVPGVDRIWKWWHIKHKAYELIQVVAGSAPHVVAACYSTEDAAKEAGTPEERKRFPEAAQHPNGGRDE